MGASRAGLPAAAAPSLPAADPPPRATKTARSAVLVACYFKGHVLSEIVLDVQK